MTLDAPLNSRAILVACMPKSGSTFLSALIASLPGFRREHVVPSYKRREQELCNAKLQRAFEATHILRRAFDQGLLTETQRPRAFVFQNHVRHNHETQVLIDRYRIVPIVLVRNIFDVVVSLRDHLARESYFTPLAYVDEAMADWDDERMHAFIVDMAVPWYIHFYVSWAKAEHRHFVTYEELTADPAETLRKALAFAKIPRTPEILAHALDKVQGASTRKNVGQSGRGAVLSDDLKQRVRRYCSYYPDVDFEPIGIGRGDAHDGPGIAGWANS